MSIKHNASSLQAGESWSTEKRMQLHSIFNDWHSQCSEAEWEEFIQLKEQIAPGEVCSFHRVIQVAFAEPVLLGLLPNSLLALMRARNWLQPSSVVTSAAGSARPL